MKTFDQLPYKRPKLNIFSKKIKKLILEFDSADTFDLQDKVFQKINKIQSDISSLKGICEIRHTCNTHDSFYESENDYFDQVSPQFESIFNEFNIKLFNSSFKSEFITKYGKQLFVLIELSLKIFNNDIVNDLQEENRLNSEHTRIIAQAQVLFDGEIYNLSTIDPFLESSGSDIRRRAAFARIQFYIDNKEKLAQIYDDMVKIRHKIALKLGYSNFIELGYDRMNRSDYGPEQVANFRELVRKYIVPIASDLIKRQKARLGLAELKFYDESFWFLSGNAVPNGNIVEKSKQMFSELSKETDKFFNLMLDKNLMNLDSMDGKATGGYCSFIEKYKYPYIFSNFNGTSEDIEILVHEAGHAFQVYCSKNVKVNSYHWPTYDACEIHSMSMEFLTWPWAELFFENPDKYRFSHMASTILFLPYCVSVDEFQHFVYGNPDCSKEERDAAWRQIELKYMPWLDWDGNEFLENGGNWMEKCHIFTSPFYYIDYGLAQICAFQFWKKDQFPKLDFKLGVNKIILAIKKYQKVKKESWKNYLNLCKAGGSESFLDLLKIGNLESPFEEVSFISIVSEIENWLNSIDDFRM